MAEDEPDESSLPSLAECQFQLADWERVVRAEIARADKDIEEAERLVREGDDKLSLRGGVEGIGSGVLGGAGTLAALAIPILGVILALAGAGLATDASVRMLNWRVVKNELLHRIDRAKANRREWQSEEERGARTTEDRARNRRSEFQARLAASRSTSAARTEAQGIS